MYKILQKDYHKGLFAPPYDIKPPEVAAVLQQARPMHWEHQREATSGRFSPERLSLFHVLYLPLNQILAHQPQQWFIIGEYFNHIGTMFQSMVEAFNMVGCLEILSMLYRQSHHGQCLFRVFPGIRNSRFVGRCPAHRL